jgi:hypothetical protein
VKTLAADLWGRGRIAAEPNLGAVLARQGLPPDVEFRQISPVDAPLLYTHRSTAEAEIYFISNQANATVRVNAVFRVAGRQPELWDAVTGERRPLPDFLEIDERTHVALEMAAHQSWFVVFRKPAAATSPPGGVNFPPSTALCTLKGEWEAAFDPRWGGPAQVILPRITDWTLSPEEGLRHYSGKATYRKTFEVSNEVLQKAGDAVMIDLGAVYDLATVRLNGKSLGTVWTAPWRVKVAGALRVGTNVLEIDVVNVWNNRLVGDLAQPAGSRLTSLSLATIKPGSKLLPAGLLGPVSLQVPQPPVP